MLNSQLFKNKKLMNTYVNFGFQIYYAFEKFNNLYEIDHLDIMVYQEKRMRQAFTFFNYK